MLDLTLKEQLKGIFAALEADFTFDINVSSQHENGMNSWNFWRM